jgi:hypothetical protein
MAGVSPSEDPERLLDEWLGQLDNLAEVSVQILSIFSYPNHKNCIYGWFSIKLSKKKGE